MVYHFCIRIFSGLVPVWAATIFFKSPMVSEGLRFNKNNGNSLVSKEAALQKEKKEMKKKKKNYFATITANHAK
jgi:hypothetical protein